MFDPYVNDQADRTETAAPLGCLLADSYMLYVKTQHSTGTSRDHSSSRCMHCFVDSTLSLLPESTKLPGGFARSVSKDREASVGLHR